MAVSYVVVADCMLCVARLTHKSDNASALAEWLWKGSRVETPIQFSLTARNKKNERHKNSEKISKIKFSWLWWEASEFSTPIGHKSRRRRALVLLTWHFFTLHGTKFVVCDGKGTTPRALHHFVTVLSFRFLSSHWDDSGKKSHKLDRHTHSISNRHLRNTPKEGEIQTNRKRRNEIDEKKFNQPSRIHSVQRQRRQRRNRKKAKQIRRPHHRLVRSFKSMSITMRHSYILVQIDSGQTTELPMHTRVCVYV